MAQFPISEKLEASLPGKIEMHALGGVGAREARDGCEGPKRLN